MSKKVADQLVETLAKAGIKRIYAVTGDSLNEVNDAVRRQNDIKWVHVRHEEVGAYAAAAEAQLKGIGCCAGSSGPGHVHLINGLYDAHRSGSSVVAIASTCPTYEMGTSYFQETNTIKLFEDCSGYNQIAHTPTQFVRMLQASLQYAVGRKGVAVLGLPGDVAAGSVEEEISSLDLLPTKSVFRPHDKELEKLAQLIDSKEKITIFCGIGAKGAHDELIRLAELIKAPIAYTFRAKMSIQYDNPYEIGMTGLLGNPSAYQSMHESDLLILLGTDFPYEGFMPGKCEIVQVDHHPEKIGRRAKVNMALGGDIEDTLAALLPLLKEKQDDSFLKKQLKFYKHVRENLQTYVKCPGTPGKISPEYVASVIDRLADDDAVFTVDTGMCCVWGARYIHGTGKREMLGSFNHGSMANAMPMAIGAAFACPDRQIIALCGDGGLSMLLGDLATIAQYKLPVKLVVFNNHSLGMVKLEMLVGGLLDWQTDMVNPDFAAVAGAMGIKAYTIHDPAQVENILSTFLAAEGPALVNVHTNPDSLAMPPKIEFSQMKGFATAMAKLILNGRYQAVIETAKSNIKHLGDLL